MRIEANAEETIPMGKILRHSETPTLFRNRPTLGALPDLGALLSSFGRGALLSCLCLGVLFSCFGLGALCSSFGFNPLLVLRAVLELFGLIFGPLSELSTAQNGREVRVSSLEGGLSETTV